MIVACAVMLPSLSGAQAPALTGAAKWADSAAREIDRATITSDLARLQAVRTLLDRALVAFPNDPLLLHYQGFELFRESGLLDGLRRSAEVPALMEKARAILERSNSLKPMPETHALLSSVLGRMIGADPEQAMTLGPQSQEEMGAAVATGANNPRVWLLRSIGSIYTPVEYGGGLPIAEDQLNKAIEFFNNDHPVVPAPSWGKAEAYAWLGQVLQKENKPGAAAAYDKALALEPNYLWVKSVLLPSVKK
jgi:tetratricopeptide (TPR) repeat protein